MECLKTTMVGLDYNMLSAELISVGLSFPPTPSKLLPICLLPPQVVPSPTC